MLSLRKSGESFKFPTFLSPFPQKPFFKKAEVSCVDLNKTWKCANSSRMPSIFFQKPSFPSHSPLENTTLH